MNPRSTVPVPECSASFCRNTRASQRITIRYCYCLRQRKEKPPACHQPVCQNPNPSPSPVPLPVLLLSQIRMQQRLVQRHHPSASPPVRDQLGSAWASPSSLLLALKGFSKTDSRFLRDSVFSNIYSNAVL